MCDQNVPGHTSTGRAPREFSTRLSRPDVSRQSAWAHFSPVSLLGILKAYDKVTGMGFAPPQFGCPWTKSQYFVKHLVIEIFQRNTGILEYKQLVLQEGKGALDPYIFNRALINLVMLVESDSSAGRQRTY